MTPHHDTLIISPTVPNCLAKRIQVENGSFTKIIFLAAYKDLRLEKDALIQKVTPLIGFSCEVKQTVGEVTLTVYKEGVNMSLKFMVIDCNLSCNTIMGCPWIHDMGPTYPLSIKQSSFPLLGESRRSEGNKRTSISVIKQP